MLIVVAETPNQAWTQVLQKLMLASRNCTDATFAIDELVVLKITKSQIEAADPLFPMKQSDLELINKYICTGECEEQVVHEWSKLYHHRMFDPPHSQVDFIIKQLKSSEIESKCQISLWDKAIDQTAEIAPCTQIIWARIKAGTIELHVHAHSVDAYKKMLLNIQEFITFHHYLAQKVGLPVGPFYHLIDSCHIYQEDLPVVQSVVKKLAQRQLV